MFFCGFPSPPPPPPPPPTVHDEVAHRRAANRAIGVSAVGLGLTGTVELALALVTGSVGLLGDALHNLSDVSTSIVVFIGFAVSKKPPSRRYPYGYERAEDLSGLGVALVIWASAVFAGVESYRKLVNHSATTHLAIGMVGAVLGIVGNQAVARYKAVVGRRIQSATLVADAHHSWLDALSSAGALVGLAAVALGYRWGDPVAGFAVTAFILHVGYEVTAELVHHLMDGLDPQVLDDAERAALGVDGVHGAQARGRWMGRTLVVEVEGGLDPAMNVSGATRLGRAVEEAVRAAVPEARQVCFIPRPLLDATSVAAS
ncbi:MAG: cation diffusion facilitator family transporter [Acidimicrobiales bacterium]